MANVQRLTEAIAAVNKEIKNATGNLARADKAATDAAVKRAALEEMAKLQESWDKLYSKVSKTQMALYDIQMQIDQLITEMNDESKTPPVDHSEQIGELEKQKAALRTKQFEKDEAEFNKVQTALDKLYEADAKRQMAEENARREAELKEE